MGAMTRSCRRDIVHGVAILRSPFDAILSRRAASRTLRQVWVSGCVLLAHLLRLELAGGHQAAANPPDSLLVPRQKPFGLDAIRVVLVGQCIAAGCRENAKAPRRLATPDPRRVAGFEARFATTVAAAGARFQRGDPPHDWTFRRSSGCR